MAQFAIGDEVHVRADFDIQGHVRTPWYCRDKSGVVERICGVFGKPESLSVGGDGKPEQPLYRVHFKQNMLWPDYAGPSLDTVEIEIFEHWLEPAE